MDQELLHFDDSDAEEGEAAPRAAKKANATKGKVEEQEQEQTEQADASQKVLTTAMVQAWCTAAKEQHKLVRRCCAPGLPQRLALSSQSSSA
jgi:hypothetical protein